MRSPYLAVKTDLIEQLSYGPALASLFVQNKIYAGSTIRPQAEKTIISLTSFPERLSKVHNCIRSLLSQTVKPAKVVLYLTEQECSNIVLPRKLAALQNAGLEVRIADTNLRSFNKLFHALRDFPDYTIVTCDDDKLYPANWLEGLVTTHKQHPGQVVCNRARHIRFDVEGQPWPYLKWPAADKQRPSMSLLPLGVGGVLYPEACLDVRVLDTALYTKLCPTADDLWLKAMAMLNGTRTVKVLGSKGIYPSIPFWNGQKLSPENIWNNGNNTALNNIMQHFDLSASDFTDADCRACVPTAGEIPQ
jgi:hypothetical protein